MKVHEGRTPTDTKLRAGIYSRISKDDEGDEKGVTRQEKDGRQDLRERGLQVVDTYRDDDVSADGSKYRARYQDMLADLRSGRIDAVWAWSPDRLQRSLKEFVEFHDLCTELGTLVLWEGGQADYSAKGDPGVGHLDRLAYEAREELRRLTRRVVRTMAELREDGKWLGGPLPYGYDYEAFEEFNESTGKTEHKLRLVVDPEEAKVLKEAARRALAGESLSKICADFERRGIPAKKKRIKKGGQMVPTRGKWVPTTLRRTLRSPAISGRIEHDGEILRDAEWEAIIPAKESDELRRLFKGGGPTDDRELRLLSGIATCGKCGTPMVSGRRKGRRIYQCRTGPGFGGCGGATISAEPVDEIVADEVVQMIDSGALKAVLFEERADDVEAADAELDEVKAELKELSRKLGAREIYPEEYEGAREGLVQRRKRLEAVTEGARRALRLPELPDPLEGHWEELPTKDKRAVLKAVLASLRIMPATRMGRTFDPGRIQVDWKA